MFLFGKRKQRKEKRRVPKTVQQSIPIDKLYKDGVFKCGNKYSKTWRFSDINYAVASDDDQLSMFLAHSALINGLPTDAMAKISVFNRQLSKEVLSSLAAPNGDIGYTVYANELAEIFSDKMADSNNIVHDKYITISSDKKNAEEARTFFTRVGNDLSADFAKLSSHTTELGYKDRLRVFYDFFKNGDSNDFEFNMKREMAKGKSFKDKICPDSIEFKSDHIRMGDKFARVIFLKEYPSFLKDSMLSELTDFSRSMMLSVDIQPRADYITVSHTTETVTVNDVSTTILKITVTGMTKDELMEHYSLTAKQREAVETLLEHNDVITASSHSLAITNADVQSIIDGLPDSLPQKRKDVVKNAGSLVGKVNYFWGGKSSAIGWDSAWGTMRKVTAQGSPTTGAIRAYGLDCSGFVTWVFNNSGMSVGHGTQGQKAASTQVSSVQAGDLAFVSDYSHVGIVVGKDTSGNILVIHCSSGANNVVLSTASGSGFNIFRRPECY